MADEPRSTSLMVSLGVVALALIAVDVSDGPEGPTDTLRSATHAALAPAQEASAGLAVPVRRGAEQVGSVFTGLSELEELRARVAELERTAQDARELSRENSRLRQLVDFESRSALDTLPARVIAFGSSDFEWTVTVAAGRDDGVGRNQIVVNDRGLVGRVIDVTPTTARILLAIDPAYGVAARNADDFEQGQLRGTGPGLLSFEPLDARTDLRAGVTVETSGYDGGLYPAGIPVGVVEDPGKPNALLQRNARVRPFVDFSRLDIVLIVRDTGTSDEVASGDFEPEGFEEDIVIDDEAGQ